MGCCGSRDVIPDAPDEIIPDPSEQEACVFTIKQAATLSRDYIAYKGTESQEKNDRWFFLNKGGSKWGGDVYIEVENFVRGTVADEPKKGQVLWRADFKDNPVFSQQLRVSGMNLFDMAFDEWMSPCNSWGDDNHYTSMGSWSRDYYTTLVINWTMRSEAVLTSTMRAGWGVPVKLAVFSCGTAVARYYEIEEPIYEERTVGTDDEGNSITESIIVGHRTVWRKDVNEYVDMVQFGVLDANTGLPLLMSDSGAPCVFTVPGDASDWTNNFGSQFFTVQQEGGWFTKKPPVVTTNAGTDPTLALLLAHLCTKEFSTKAIKENFSPNFPYDPKMGIVFGLF